MPTDLPEANAEVHFERATLCIARQAEASRDLLRLEGELARSPEQRSLGLMDRAQLAANAGMLFLYERSQSGRNGFWMYRTRIPLDIAYLDGAGRILSIREMEPCTVEDAADCPSYPAGHAFKAALEVNRGYFARQRIQIGDQVWASSTPDCRRSPRP